MGLAGEELLLLPDRNVFLQAFDAVTARLERVPAMRRGAGHDNARLTDGKVAGAMQDGDLRHRPLRGHLSGDLVQPRDGQLVPRLVAETGHVAGLRMVAYRPDEHTCAARARVGDGSERLVHREGIGCHTDDRST